MQRKNIIILIIILMTVAVLFFGYLILFPNSKPAEVVTNISAPDFFPFPAAPKSNEPAKPANVSTPASSEEPANTTPAVEKILKKVSSFPIAGYGLFEREIFAPVMPVKTEEEPLPDPLIFKERVPKAGEVKPTAPATEFVSSVRYAKRTDGNIYQTEAGEINERKFTSTVIPIIYEAFFANRPNAVILRYLKEDNTTIESFLGKLPADQLGADSTGMEEVKGSFLPENVTNVSVSPDGANFFYLFDLNDTAVGITASASGDKKTQVFSSPFTEWISQWAAPKMITLTTKAADGVPGYMYAVNTDKKTVSGILGNINGLTTLTSPSGKLVLYGSSNNGNLNASIYNIDTGVTIPLGARTLPEKCVFTKASDTIYCAVPKYLPRTLYPDSWYQGTLSFSDEIWKIDSFTGVAVKIADPTEITGEEVDGINLGLDQNEKYLFFINKKDSYLWELGLN